MCVKRMLYCPGSGQELFSAFGVTMEYHDSSVFLIRKLPLSITEALFKAVALSNESNRIDNKICCFLLLFSIK